MSYDRFTHLVYIRKVSRILEFRENWKGYEQNSNKSGFWEVAAIYLHKKNDRSK